MRLPGRIPLAPPGVTVTGHAPVVSCAKNAVCQWELSHCLCAEWADSAMGVNLMNNVPHAVQAIADDKQNRQPETENTEYAEHNHRSSFKSPSSLISKIGGECQIKCRNSNKKQGKKELNCFCREYFLRNEIE